MIKPCTTIRQMENPVFMGEMLKTKRWWSMIWLRLRLALGRLPEFRVNYSSSTTEVICGESVRFAQPGSCFVKFVRVGLEWAVLAVREDGDEAIQLFDVRFPGWGCEVVLDPVKQAV